MSSSGQSLFITEVTIHYRKDYGVLVTFRKIVNNKTIVTLTLEAVTKLCSEISKKKKPAKHQDKNSYWNTFRRTLRRRIQNHS